MSQKTVEIAQRITEVFERGGLDAVSGYSYPGRERAFKAVGFREQASPTAFIAVQVTDAARGAINRAGEGQRSGRLSHLSSQA